MIIALRGLILSWLLCFSVVYAQQYNPPQKPPQCAVDCLIKATATGACALTDSKCVCSNPVFKANVTACVTLGCTIPEAMVAQNVSLTTCGAPVRDRGQNYVTLSNVMVSVAGAFVAIRFAFKGTFSRLEFGWDDWTVLACFITTIPSAIITVYGTVKNGLGRDIWTLRPDETTNMLRYFYAMASIYFTQLTLLKLTLLFFYVRIFPGPAAQKLLWGTVAFTTAWGIAYIIVAIFQCRPINYFWLQWDGLHKGTCLDINAITASNASISIVLDLWILGIPLWQLWGLKMHWKKKVGVGMMFCVGTFVTIVSILRLQALVHFAASHNKSWEFYDVSVWSSIEICVGIMCACLPTVRLLLVKIFPILGGSSARSRNNYHNYGSGTDLKSFGKSGNKSRTQNTSTVAKSPTTGVFDNHSESDQHITVKTSYTVEHSHSDTDSLVSSKNGDLEQRR